MTERGGAPGKQAIREHVWDLMQREGAARFPGATGRIPNFAGAERAAERLAEERVWLEAGVLKVNPDFAQLPVRARALRDGKRLYMAVPRLREPRPFVSLDPARVTAGPRRAATIKGAMQLGGPVTIGQMGRVDLVVCGTVAVNRRGVRIGKGGGYSDLELALLTEAGLVDDRTVVATTVHPLQVLDQDLPETAHDFRVDLIVAPDEVIRPRRPSRGRRRPGILWKHLDAARVAAIPVLAAMATERQIHLAEG